jgi:tRNA(Ile)-lysidine synthase
MRPNIAAPSPGGHLSRMAASALVPRLRDHLAETRLLTEPGLAVLAVSGGGDSLALLDLLAALGGELRVDLLVAHADHGILPDSRDLAERVARLARDRYGIATVTTQLHLGPEASETRARIARYRFLRAVQAERGARYLVTAHHADDQVETVLLRVLRGSAPSGLRGIEAAGPRGLVRPLLPYRHAELLAHATAAGLPVAEDPTNADPRHLRGWVRGVLRPVIEQRLGPGAGQAVLTLARHAVREVKAWDRVLDLLPGLDVSVSDGRLEVARGTLSGYDNVLAARVLRAAARRAGLHVTPRTAVRVARFAADAESGRRVTLGDGVAGEVAFESLILTRETPTPAAWLLDPAGGEATFGRFALSWRKEQAPAAVPRTGWTTWLPAGALGVRAVRPGDRMVPIGGVGRRKVTRLLMDARVPRLDRAAYPVVTSEGLAVWVPGVCRAAARVAAPGTEAVRIDARAG